MPQIENEGIHPLRFQFVQCGGEFRSGGFVELGDACIADAGLCRAPLGKDAGVFDAGYLDDFAGEFIILHLTCGGAPDCEAYFFSGIATEFFDGLVEWRVVGVLSVDFENLVAWKNTRLEAWRVLHRVDHCKNAGFLGDHYTESTKFAARVLLHVFEALGLHELAVGIEVVEHPPKRVVGEFLVVHLGLVHIVLPDELHGTGEELELLVGRILGFWCGSWRSGFAGLSAERERKEC